MTKNEFQKQVPAAKYSGRANTFFLNSRDWEDFRVFAATRKGKAAIKTWDFSVQGPKRYT